mmetsp:Transcript_12882/g.33444  ORF Transcript_12882/g.33444 Transcript_12882/m.33444 type:complete len:115 (+) Transcript_12882:167-511(+)
MHAGLMPRKTWRLPSTTNAPPEGSLQKLASSSCWLCEVRHWRKLRAASGQGHDAYASINGRTFCCRSSDSVPSVSIGGFQCNGTVCTLGAMRYTCSDDPGSPWVNIHNFAQKDP